MSLFAAVQLNSQDQPEQNLAQAQTLIRQAAAAGAQLVALPETFAYIGPKTGSTNYQQALDGELMQALAQLSRELGIYLLAGSLHEAVPGESKVYNTSVLLDPQGQRVSVYRKIHLFDIEAPDLQLKESEAFLAGDASQQAVVATPLGHLATTICYDLRFPELYRRLSAQGAEVIFVPAAFTLQTGRVHWEVLLRARAIENQVYIVAPNQTGHHPGQRQSYGHSLIIDPWGQILAQAGQQAGFILAEIDLDYLAQVRRNLPCLQHQRLT